MKGFETEYRQLNDAQRAAVDTIDGPLLVLAGPGTGKTQLLAMRVANILQKTDTPPRNILCLTFTESARDNMRERLYGLIGSDAYKVAIHTFHSFGSEIINQYPEHFYHGARFAPADEVVQVEILEAILRDLPHENPLASTMNDQLVYLRSVNQAIGYFKRAGLGDEELEQIIARNQAVVAEWEPKLQDAMPHSRLRKQDLPQLWSLVDESSEAEKTEPLPTPFRPLPEVLLSTLRAALEEAQESGKTTPVTAWRNQWLEKNAHNQYVLKDRARTQRLQALADVYGQYQQALRQRQRYDFSDMVLEVLAALEHTPQLRYQLQEQYHYLLVDEFQDTNDGQLRLLHQLADSPVHEGSPDIMAVGDDDQAIYKFQGAEVNNVRHFQAAYPDARLITLSRNYRSRQDILDYARRVITQAENRLEPLLEGVDKRLQAAGSTPEGVIDTRLLPSVEEEYAWVAARVTELIEQGVAPGEIAIIGRQHAHLEELMPHLRAHDVPVAYERRQNVLEEHHIRQLLELARLVQAQAEGRHEEEDARLSQVLSLPFWGIDPLELWRISRQAHRQRQGWFETIFAHGSHRLQRVAEFLVRCAKAADTQPLEYTLDQLIGTRPAGDFRSPYREYYFSQEQFETDRGVYIAFLSALRLLRNKLREYRQHETIYLADLIEFVDTYETNQLQLVDETPFVSSDEAVQVLSAHKAKGLEFHTVFILSCQESIWASTSGRQQLRMPSNLPISPPGDELDDQLRLFYVAMTRSRANLYLSAHTTTASGKPAPLVPFIPHEDFSPAEATPDPVETIEAAWQSYHPLPTTEDAAAVLRPLLDTYQLNATHLIKFLDVVRGGPRSFLLESLLQFPQAPTPAAAYGSAVHHTLRDLYRQLQTGASADVGTGLGIFEQHLCEQRLQSKQQERYLEQGKQELAVYLEQRLPAFDPKHLVEVNFRNQGVTLNAARLSGQIDKLVLDPQSKTAAVHDFKTGKPLQSWNRNSGSEGEKTWKYRLQLIFYKLLVEGSRSWSEYTVDEGVLEFIKPHEETVWLLSSTITDEDVQRLQRLIQVVWGRIQALDFPDTSHYPKDITGIRQFEADLLAEAAAVSAADTAA